MAKERGFWISMIPQTKRVPPRNHHQKTCEQKSSTCFESFEGKQEAAQAGYDWSVQETKWWTLCALNMAVKSYMGQSWRKKTIRNSSGRCALFEEHALTLKLLMCCSQTKAPWIGKRRFPKNLASLWWNLHQAHPTTQHTTYEAPLPQHKWHGWVEGSRFCWPFLDHQGSDREQPSKSRTAQRNAQAVPLLPLWREASAPRDQPPTANAAKTPMCPRTPPTPSRLQRSSWKGTGRAPAWYPWTPHRLRKEVHSAMIGCRASPQANGIEGWSKVISCSLLPSRTNRFPHSKGKSEVNHHFKKLL